MKRRYSQNLLAKICNRIAKKRPVQDIANPLTAEKKEVYSNNNFTYLKPLSHVNPFLPGVLLVSHHLHNLDTA